MAKRQSVEEMQELRRKLRARLGDVFRSRAADAGIKADKIAKRITDLNSEIAAALIQREDPLRRAKNARQQTANR
jgi:hypothetical protein